MPWLEHALPGVTLWGLALGLAYLVLLPMWGWSVVRRVDAPLLRWGAVALWCAVSIALPWIAGGELVLFRFVLCLFALMGMGKLIDTARGQVHDPLMWESYLRYALWVFVANDTAWPTSPEALRENRREGWRRLLRVLLKGAALAGLIAVNSAAPLSEPGFFWLQMFWALWVTYLAFSGIIDLVAIGLLLAGLGVGEVFDAPVLARSPRDFWSRRWNLWFRGCAHRNVFLPLGGEKRPLVAATAVFVVSAVVHEFIVIASLGGTNGWMGAFFLIHGVATIGLTVAGRRLGRRELMPRAAAVALHVVWLTATAPLFFEPFMRIMPIDQWRFG